MATLRYFPNNKGRCILLISKFAGSYLLLRSLTNPHTQAATRTYLDPCVQPRWESECNNRRFSMTESRRDCLQASARCHNCRCIVIRTLLPSLNDPARQHGYADHNWRGQTPTTESRFDLRGTRMHPRYNGTTKASWHDVICIYECDTRWESDCNTPINTRYRNKAAVTCLLANAVRTLAPRHDWPYLSNPEHRDCYPGLARHNQTVVE